MQTKFSERENHIDCYNGEKYYQILQFDNSEIDDIYFGYMMYRAMTWFKKYKYMFVKFTESTDSEVVYDVYEFAFYCSNAIYLNSGEGYLMEPNYIKSLSNLDLKDEEIYAHKLEFTPDKKIVLSLYLKKSDEYLYYEIF